MITPASVSYTHLDVYKRQERDSLEAKSLSRLNELRSARGLAPVKKGDKIKDEAYDFVQEESLQIMIDLIKLGGVGEKSTKVASTINLSLIHI